MQLLRSLLSYYGSANSDVLDFLLMAWVLCIVICIIYLGYCLINRKWPEAKRAGLSLLGIIVFPIAIMIAICMGKSKEE